MKPKRGQMNHAFVRMQIAIEAEKSRKPISNSKPIQTEKGVDTDA